MDTQWLGGGGKTPTFCVFMLFSVLVMKTCCDSCGDVNTTSGRVSRRQRVLLYELHQLPLTGSRWDIRWVSGGGRTPTFCVIPVFIVAVKEKCCDACGDEVYNSRSGCSAPKGANVSAYLIAVDRKSMGPTVAERSWKDADFLCNYFISVAVMEKCCERLQ
jgi:hypothetical protein